jgi:ribosome-binding factor A
MDRRPLRVQKLVREELSKIILRELEFPGALVTITEVVVDKKLGMARVKVSVLPADKANEVLKILEKNSGMLQHLLLRKINIKPMPRIRFEIDRGPENAARVEKALLGR